MVERETEIVRERRCVALVFGILSVVLALAFLSAFPAAALAQEGLASGIIPSAAEQATTNVSSGDLTPDASGENAPKLSSGSTTFKASKTKLNLTPKKKKIANGYKYVTKKKTITVTVPRGATVYFKSSNYAVASAKWAKKWKKNTIKLTVYGHARGKAVITLTNSKTKKKVKIKVTVGGYNLGFRWEDAAEKRYIKPDGTNGYYCLNNVKVTNKTGKKVQFTKKSVFKVWTVDSDGDYVNRGDSETIRGVPITIGKGKSKRLYLGDKEYPDANGKYGETTYWYKGCFTVKIGSSYKTVYVNEYGMVTKVRNGRDF